MTALKSLGAIVGLVLLVVIMGCIFTVSEGQRALLLRLGKLTTDSAGKVLVYEPGLHFKLPFINTVREYDVRLRTMAVNESRILTEGQKYVIVDYYVKWRIDDLARYFQRTGGSPLRAESLLEKRLNNALRSSIGQITLLELISGERANVMRELQRAADATAEDIGIKVVDVRIKRADLPEEVALSVFERMR
ncbi:MAG: protease modulator HflC, partial [Coxiellaceae bacterium]|nr:protease modulator HflC [Coxiellaceae bacterium]